MDNILQRLLQLTGLPSLNQEHRSWSARIFQHTEEAFVHSKGDPGSIYYFIALDALETALKDPPDCLDTAELAAWKRVTNDFAKRRKLETFQEELKPEPPKPQPRRRDRLRGKFTRKAR